MREISQNRSKGLWKKRDRTYTKLVAKQRKVQIHWRR